MTERRPPTVPKSSWMFTTSSSTTTTTSRTRTTVDGKAVQMRKRDFPAKRTMTMGMVVVLSLTAMSQSLWWLTSIRAMTTTTTSSSLTNAPQFLSPTWTRNDTSLFDDHQNHRRNNLMDGGWTVVHEIDHTTATATADDNHDNDAIPTSIADYLHVSNVAYNVTTNTLYFFGPSDRVRRALQRQQEQLQNQQQPRLAPYKRFSRNQQIFDLPQPYIVVIADRAMDPTLDCPTIHQNNNIQTTSNSNATNMRYEAAYFYSPWVTNNLFHTLHDNTLPMVDNLWHTPECSHTNNSSGGDDDDTAILQCRYPTTLYLFPGNDDNNVKQVAAADVFRRSLFDSVQTWKQGVAANNSSMSSGSLCFAQFSWGRGPSFYYDETNTLQERAQNAVAALNARVRAHLGLPSRRQVQDKILQQQQQQQKQQQPTAIVKAVYVNRNGTEERHIRDPRPILEACREMGWYCVDCCQWSTASVRDVLEHFVDAQVVFGAHGAGLTNFLFAVPHATLVEFGDNGPDWDTKFERMVQSLPGTRVHVPLLASSPRGAYHWSQETALQYFRQVQIANMSNSS